MPTIINSIEQLMQFLNDKGVLEIAQRRKDQKFKKFQNVIIDPSLLNRAQEQIQNEIKKALNINNDLIKSSLSKINAPLGKFCVLGEKDEANNDVVRSILNQAQFEILENETILLTNQKSDGITLSALSNTPDPSKISTSSEQYNLLITHMPDTLTNEELSTKSISLALNLTIPNRIL